MAKEIKYESIFNDDNLDDQHIKYEQLSTYPSTHKVRAAQYIPEYT